MINTQTTTTVTCDICGEQIYKGEHYKAVADRNTFTTPMGTVELFRHNGNAEAQICGSCHNCIMDVIAIRTKESKHGH